MPKFSVGADDHRSPQPPRASNRGGLIATVLGAFLSYTAIKSNLRGERIVEMIGLSDGLLGTRLFAGASVGRHHGLQTVLGDPLAPPCGLRSLAAQSFKNDYQFHLPIA